MRHLFFSLEGEFEAVATRVFRALGLQTPRWGNSANAFGGTYADYAIDGVIIRLERNSYDYEDEFDYMIAIKGDPLAEGHVSDDSIRSVATSNHHLHNRAYSLI